MKPSEAKRSLFERVGPVIIYVLGVNLGIFLSSAAMSLGVSSLQLSGAGFVLIGVIAVSFSVLCWLDKPRMPNS